MMPSPFSLGDIRLLSHSSLSWKFFLACLRQWSLVFLWSLGLGAWMLRRRRAPCYNSPYAMSYPQTAQPRRLVSIVFSFRNEEQVLPDLLARLQPVADRLPCNCEFIFVNDASTDQSLSLLTEHARKDPRIKIITLSRRFGVAEGFLAGITYARGDAVVTMDTDL